MYSFYTLWSSTNHVDKVGVDRWEVGDWALVVKSKKVSEKNALLSEVHFWIENE